LQPQVKEEKKEEKSLVECESEFSAAVVYFLFSH